MYTCYGSGKALIIIFLNQNRTSFSYNTRKKYSLKSKMLGFDKENVSIIKTLVVLDTTIKVQ